MDNDMGAASITHRRPSERIMENIAYRTAELERHFSRNRIRWSQFYESERQVIEHVNPDATANTLDIGCGCGGLGLALRERFGVEKYTGVEINNGAAESARRLNPEAKILHGDFLRMTTDVLPEESYDLAFSLGCIDWNLTFDNMLRKLWSMVKPGGALISSFRITLGPGVNDITRSYQYINFDGHMEGEIAPYVVVNAADLMAKITALGTRKMFGYGFYGPPGKTAVTPYAQLCFAALAIYKVADMAISEIDLRLPPDISRLVHTTR